MSASNIYLMWAAWNEKPGSEDNVIRLENAIREDGEKLGFSTTEFRKKVVELLHDRVYLREAVTQVHEELSNQNDRCDP